MARPKSKENLDTTLFFRINSKIKANIVRSAKRLSRETKAPYSASRRARELIEEGLKVEAASRKG